MITESIVERLPGRGVPAGAVAVASGATIRGGVRLMMFMLAENEPTLFVMLLPSDIETMKPGRTLFVDPRQLQGHTFNRVILSYHPSKQAINDMLRQAGKNVQSDSVDGKYIVTPRPEGTEAECDECGAILQSYLLQCGKCITCWRTLYVRALGNRN